MTKKIGIDFDDVLQSFNDSLMAFYNARFGTTFKRDQVTEYYIEKLYGKTQEEMFDVFTEFCFSKHHTLIEPVKGSQEAITELAKKYQLIIITARAKVLQEVTQAWLDIHFPNIFKEIHYSRDTWKDIKKKKSETAQELDIDYFIEDSLENAVDIAGVGIPVFLLNTPWNQGMLATGITRVHSWDEIQKSILN